MAQGVGIVLRELGLPDTEDGRPKDLTRDVVRFSRVKFEPKNYEDLRPTTKRVVDFIASDGSTGVTGTYLLGGPLLETDQKSFSKFVMKKVRERGKTIRCYSGSIDEAEFELQTNLQRTKTCITSSVLIEGVVTKFQLDPVYSDIVDKGLRYWTIVGLGVSHGNTYDGSESVYSVWMKKLEELVGDGSGNSVSKTQEESLSMVTFLKQRGLDGLCFE